MQKYDHPDLVGWAGYVLLRDTTMVFVGLDGSEFVWDMETLTPR